MILDGEIILWEIKRDEKVGYLFTISSTIYLIIYHLSPKHQAACSLIFSSQFSKWEMKIEIGEIIWLLFSLFGDGR